MGWYDAFKGDTARIDMSKATSDTGSAFKNLGDAFGTIGKTMNESEIQKKKDKFLEAQSKNMDLSNAFYENSMADRLGAEKNKNLQGQEDVKVSQGTTQNKIKTSELDVSGKQLDNAFKEETNPYKINDVKNNSVINHNKAEVSTATKGNDIENSNLTVTKNQLSNAYDAGTLNTRINDTKNLGTINHNKAEVSTATKGNDIENSNLTTSNNKIANDINIQTKQNKIDDAYTNTDMNKVKLNVAQQIQDSQITNAKLAPELTQTKIDSAKASENKLKPIEFNKFVRDKEATDLDGNGERIVTKDNKKIIDYKATQGLKYRALGYNENDAYDLATLDYAKVLKAELKKTDPLNKKQLNTESTPQSKSPKASKSDDFLGLDI